MWPGRGAAEVGGSCRRINWKLIAFIGVLWWLIYSAPTEDSLFTMFVHKAGGTSASDDF